MTHPLCARQPPSPQSADATITDAGLAMFARDTLQGLAYMHGIEYKHRDLKPPNILYTRDRFLCVQGGPAPTYRAQCRGRPGGLGPGAPTQGGRRRHRRGPTQPRSSGPGPQPAMCLRFRFVLADLGCSKKFRT